MRFSTRGRSANDQFEAYRAFCAPAIELSLPAGCPPEFEVDHLSWDMGRLALTEARLPGPPSARHWRHLRRDPLDHWCLVLATCPGQPHLLGFRSLARPFEGEASDTHVLSLYIPRDLFGAEAAIFDQLAPVLPATGLSLMLGDYLQSLVRHLPQLDPATLPALVETTRLMLAACLSPQAERLHAAHEPLVATLRERARLVVRQHMRSPALGADLLCRELGVSRSRLYRLFEPLGGVMRYIQRQRLLAAHARLCDPANVTPIVQIAYESGFPDASGFSRAFKAEFDSTPRQVREAALSNPPPPRAGRPPAPRLDNLGDLLRGLSA